MNAIFRSGFEEYLERLEHVDLSIYALPVFPDVQRFALTDDEQRLVMTFEKLFSAFSEAHENRRIEREKEAVQETERLLKEAKDEHVEEIAGLTENVRSYRDLFLEIHLALHRRDNP